MKKTLEMIQINHFNIIFLKTYIFINYKNTNIYNKFKIIFHLCAFHISFVDLDIGTF
jgi:hypothetical protein